MSGRTTRQPHPKIISTQRPIINRKHLPSPHTSAFTHHLPVFCSTHTVFLPMRLLKYANTLSNIGRRTKMAIEAYPDHIIFAELPPEPDIRKEVEEVMKIVQADTGFDVVVDFSRVDIITSLTLSGFLQLRRMVTDAGHRLVFCNVAPLTKDIFKVTCFEGLFDYADNKATAFDKLQLQKK